MDRETLAAYRRRRAERLTGRGKTVLQMVAAGQTREEIGRVLGISRDTVNGHLSSAARILGANTSWQAIAIAVLYDIVDRELVDG